MYTTLEHLEKHIKKQKTINKPKSIFKELKLITIIFVVTFVGMLLFTNAQLFFGGLVTGSEKTIVNWDNNSTKTDSTISSIVTEDIKKQETLESIISSYEDSSFAIPKSTSLSTKQELKTKLKNYDFDFNILPPTDRLIIPKINLDVPLIDSKYKNKTDFVNGDFNDELENGVVKYPTTPEPGFPGNTLLFGHTSQEWRQHNPYGTVFSHIPELEQGDIMQIIRKGKLYEYKIVEKTIVRPSQVDKQYQSYQKDDRDYVTIMGCYPLGRTDKRMMITAVRVK